MFSLISSFYGIDDVRNCCRASKNPKFKKLEAVFYLYYNFKKETMSHKKLADLNSKNSVNMPNSSEKESGK